MKKAIGPMLFVLFLCSCIPLRIAPKINDHKVTVGKRFKKNLPSRSMFIFEDPKEANEFYRYVDVKYGLGNAKVEDDAPFMVENNQYFFSFYEVEIPTKTINFLPMVIDGLLDQTDVGPIMEDAYSSRTGHWYIAIEVYSDTEKDCLQENSLSRKGVLKYLRSLKEEYLSTHNYNEVVFKN